MSVRGRFGYKNSLPNTGSFSVIINLKAVYQGNVYRQLFFNKYTSITDASPYIEISTNNRLVFFTVKTGSTAETVTYTAPDDNIRLEYMLFDFDGTNIRFWNPYTSTYQTIVKNIYLGTDNYAWMYAGPTALSGGGGAQNPDVSYYLILDRLLDENLVNTIASGVHPFDNFNLTSNIVFFREYPHHSTAGYHTDFGVAELAGIPSSATLNYGCKQFGQYSAVYNPDRGVKLAISNSLTFGQAAWKLLNDTVVFSHTLHVQQAALYPIDRTLVIASNVRFPNSFSLIDKYINASNELTFEQEYLKTAEIVINCGNDVLTQLVIKPWDGKISTSLNFTTALYSSIKLFDLLASFIFSYSEIESNQKIEGWKDTCTLVHPLTLEENETYKVDTSDGEALIISERIGISLDSNRLPLHEVSFKCECEIYLISAEDLVNYK